jgi:hypothetical protein
VAERKWDQGSKISDHDTPPVPSHLPPLGLHALPQGERKHLLHPAACLRGALDILGADFTCDLRALVGRDGCLTLCTKQASCAIVSAEIRFGPNEDERCAFAKMGHFGVPLLRQWKVMPLIRKSQAGNSTMM